MSSKTQEPAYAWRFPPCPGYDVEATESWLQEMAAQGLILSTEGFFAGFACFEKSEPRRLRYRLEAAPKKFLDEDGPNEEERSLSEAYGWQYIARRGDFLIYAGEDDGSVELHTDPRVQAISMNLVRRRARGSLFSFVLWLVLYPLALGNFMPLAAFLTIGTPVSLIGNAVVLWSVGSSAASYLSLRRLWKRLRSGESLDHRKNWQQRARWYRGSLAAYFLLCFVFLGCLLALWNADARGDFTEPYTDWQEKLPFATLEDFFPGAVFTPRGDGLLESEVDVHSDILAPQILSIHQTGSLKLPDGRTFTGGLTVDYYETAAPWMARELAREYEWYDKRRHYDSFESLPLPDSLEADYASAYSAIFPTVVLVQGNRMVHASLYQTSNHVNISLADWTIILAESLKG